MFVIPNDMFQPFSAETSSICYLSAIDIGWKYPFTLSYSGCNMDWAVRTGQKNFISLWILEFESLEGLTQGNLNWLADNLFTIAPDGVAVKMSVSWTPDTKQVIILSEIAIAEMMFAVAINDLKGLIYG